MLNELVDSLESLRHGGWVLGALVVLSMIAWAAAGWLALSLHGAVEPDALDRAEPQLNRLAAASAAMPLMGLLGTVLGMVTVFRGIGLSSGARVSPSVLWAGISQAMLTTQAGLVFALPLMAFVAILRGRLERMRARCVQDPSSHQIA